jgi:hypothetical protein
VIDCFFNRFGKNSTPVAVEVSKNSEPVTTLGRLQHLPYVFGPEDGRLPKADIP